jgi:hypothetical protein
MRWTFRIEPRGGHTIVTKPPVLRFALLAVFSALVLALVPAALAGKGKPGGGGGKPSGGGGTIDLIVLYSPAGDTLPHYNGQITFKVSTTATTQPYVQLNCYEGGVWVLSSSAGFFDSYPWPWTQNFTLSWDMWHTAGAASDCTATLYNGSTTYATKKFHVYA